MKVISGIPQGSFLRSALFNIAVSDILKAILASTDSYVFDDDITIEVNLIQATQHM